MLEKLRMRSDVIVATGVVGVVVVMLMPLHPIVLDLLLSLSIGISIVILITSIYIRRPLDFSVFPSMLLMVTLFRLSLNIAATRLILLRGNEGTDAAGHVVMAFGNFVVGGNYAVGLIVFLILVVINFVVITKGAGRIAEVAARFTLDLMPGKQMSVDADLNAGLIDEAEARRRRSEIGREADFYGAMDGASKFVRGDAIAAVVIMAVNIVGGLIIGILQHNLPIADAAATYTILTIGEGLVAQIPALLVSTAAGMVVTRAGSETNLGGDVVNQVFVNPKAMMTAAAILFVLGLVPGLPHIPFLLIATCAGGFAYVLAKTPPPEEVEQPAGKAPEEPKLESFLELDPLSLEIGYGVIPLVEEGKGELLAKIKAMRRQLASEIGFVVPPVHIKDNLHLRPNEYSFLIRGIEVARGDVMMGQYLAVSTEGAAPIEGVATKEPAFGLPAFWVDGRNIEQAQASGYMVVDPATVIATHLTELVRSHGWEFLTRSEVQSLLDSVAKSYPKLVDELVPSQLTLGGVQRVLQNLLKERVPINDLVTVLETLLDYTPTVKDLDLLTEHVRQALSRYITKQYMTQDGSVPVFTLDPNLERALLQTIEAGGAVSPEIFSRLLRSIESALNRDKLRGMQPVIICSAQVRRFLRKLLERYMPSVAVLSNAEIAPAARIYSLGMVRYEN